MTPTEPQLWTLVAKGESTDYQILRIREDTVADPRTGKTHPRVRIDAPDWVNVIALTPEGEVLLIRQFRAGIWANSLEIPGGMVDPGEAPLAAAARELEEETGFRAGSITPLGWCHPNPALQDNRMHSFLAENCRLVGAPHLDEGEDISVERVERARIDELIREGQIRHALVLTAFFFERLRLPLKER